MGYEEVHISINTFITDRYLPLRSQNMAEIPNGVVQKPMPKMIEPLSWLMGTWRCENEGHGQYPTIKSFQYGEELCFSNVGQPMLNYSSMSWHPEHKFPMHQETGLFYLLTLMSLLSKQARLS